MDTTILATRAVASTTIFSLLWPILAVVIGVYCVLFGLSWWLASAFHPLWWVVVVLVTPLFLACLIGWGISFFISSKLRPTMSASQKALSRKIADQISGIAEKVGTPKVFILMRVVYDMASRTSVKESYIGSLAKEPGELRRNFTELRDSFKKGDIIDADVIS